MKAFAAALLCLLLLVPFAAAHAIEKGPVRKSTKQHIIEFSSEPEFPVTGRETRLDFVIKNKRDVPVPNVDVVIELRGNEERIRLPLKEKEGGHYSAEYKFKKAGSYEIRLFIGNNEVETRFALEIDSFGVSGALRALVIVLFIEILAIAVISDCKKKRGKTAEKVLI